MPHCSHIFRTGEFPATPFHLTALQNLRELSNVGQGPFHAPLVPSILNRGLSRPHFFYLTATYLAGAF